MLYLKNMSLAELKCFEPSCGARYAITEVLYNCPKCGGLLEAVYEAPKQSPADLKKLFRERRLSNAPIDQSGVWRYRELFPFLFSSYSVVTLGVRDFPKLCSSEVAE